MRTVLFVRSINVMVVFVILLWFLFVAWGVVWRGFVVMVSASRVGFVWGAVFLITTIQISVLFLFYPDVVQLALLVFGPHLQNTASFIVSWLFMVLSWGLLIYELFWWIFWISMTFLIFCHLFSCIYFFMCMNSFSFDMFAIHSSGPSIFLILF